MRRIRQRYEANGLETLVHGNQGHPSPRRTKIAILEQLRALAGPTGRYHDFNVSYLAELLARDEGTNLQRSPVPVTVRASHCPASHYAPAIKRMQRERKTAEGMIKNSLLQ